jgi:hypothetical protein
MIAGSIEIQLLANIARLQRDMDQARQIVNQTTTNMTRMALAVKEALGGMLAGFSLAALGNQVLGAQREFDKLNASLITATGSGAEAAQTFKALQAFAASTPYGVKDATEAFVKLKNLGLDPSQAALRSYGNTAAAMGKGLDQMIEAVADAATGEFERLKEFGITASQNGDKVALTFKGTTTTVSKSADEIQAYLQKLGNTDFAGAMAMRAATLDGAISNLADKWDAFVLRISRGGIGDAAKFGVEVLADNLTALAGAVATVAAAKLASTIDDWATATRAQITQTAAARAATIAAAEADVAGAAAKTTQLGATQAMIVVAREEAVAKLASANTNIAAARAAIAASEAAGVQSFALRTLRLATAELQVAEAQRTAMLAELAILGRQQAAVSAQLTAALAAQTAAQSALTGATAAGGVAAGVGARAMALLGGPIGALITVLGLAATAWVWYKEKQDEATAEAAEKVGKMTVQIAGDLEKQNEKLRQRVELSRQAGMGTAAAEGGEAVERMAEMLVKINGLKAQGANISTGDSIDLIEYESQYANLKKLVDANKELKATLNDNSKSAVDFREKLTGLSASYLSDLTALKTAFDEGKIKQDEYTKAVQKLAIDTFNGSEAGKDFAKGLDMSSAAIARRAEAQGLLNQRSQEHIQFLKSSGQIDEEAAIKRTTKAQIDALNIEKAATAGQLALAYKKADNQREQADLAGKIGNINIQINNAQQKGEEELALLERQRYLDAVGGSADVIEKQMAELASLQQQTQAQEDYNAQIGLTPKQIAEITAARLRDAAARKDIEADIAEGFDLDGTMAARVRAQAAELRKQADGAVAGAVKQEMFDKNLQDANALVQIMSALDEAAQSAAQGMADSFGRVGEAIGGLTTSMTGFSKTQAAVAAQLAASLKDAAGDPIKIQRANTLAAEASAQAQVKSYGDMASAAKGFFKENSAGYKVMSGIEKAYRAAEMAMALETMVKKILFKETEVTANTALNATKLTGEAAASAASTGLAATEASAWGVTAVVKAIASMPFPLNLAAGAATLAAVVAIGAKMVGSLNGGGVSLSEQRQRDQGTGTVLGNSGAKSESIARAIELSASNSSTQINYLSGMLTSLRNIETGISSFASQVVQGGLTDGSNVSLNNGGVYNALNSKAAGGLGSLAGAGVGYAAGAGLTAFTSLAALGGPIGLVIGAVAGKFLGSALNSVLGGKKSLEDSGFTMDKASLGAILASGAKANSYADIKTDGGWFSSDKRNTQMQSLGQDANVQFSLVIESLADSVTEAGKLLGVSGAGFEAQLNSFVVDIGKVSLKGKTGDEIQKELEAVFSKLGDQMASYAVGGLQQFQKVGEGYLETLVRVASDYAKVDASLQSIGKTFGSIGVQSIAAREGLIALMGGIDDFQSKTAGFASNFLTKEEQLAPVSKFVDDQLAALGLGYVKSRDQFKAVALSQDLSTAAGQKLFASLMDLQEAFAATHAAAVDLTKTEQEVADERKDLQDQLDQLTLTQTQLLQKQRYALAEANRPLWDMVQAAQKLADTSSNLTKFRDAAKSLSDTMLTGSLSPLTPEQQEGELHRQYEAMKAAAMAGDTKAQDGVFSALTAWLTASQKLNAGDSQYQADFAEGQRDTAAFAAWATKEVDSAQAQLDAMNSQTTALESANTALNAANTILQTIAQNTSITGGVAAAPNAANVIGTALSALGTAIKAVQSEVAGLRKDQNTQTADQITANAEGQKAIVDSVNKGASKTTTTVEKVALE